MRKVFTLLMVVCCAAFAFGAGKHYVRVAIEGITDGAKSPASKMYEAGKKVTVTITPGKNCFVDKWTDYRNSIPILGVGNSYSFIMPEEDVTLVANIVDQYQDAKELKSLKFTMTKLPSYEQDEEDATYTVDNHLEAKVGMLMRGLLETTMANGPYSRLTAKFTGLPKGLTVTTTNVTKILQAKPLIAFTHQCWLIEGVPAETLDFETAPAFVTFTSQGKSERCIRLPINISGKLETPSTPSRVGQVGKAIDEYCIDEYIGLGRGWGAKKGLPPGISVNKYTGNLAGTPTKTGSYTIECSRKVSLGKKSYTETVPFLFTVNPPMDMYAGFNNVPTSFESSVGENIAEDFGPYLENGLGAKVTGLPDGLKYTDKFIRTKVNGEDTIIESYYVYGKPTKAGSYVVTLSKTSNGTPITQQIIWTVKAPKAPAIEEYYLWDEGGYMLTSGGGPSPEGHSWDAAAVTRAGQILELNQKAPETILMFKAPAKSKVAVAGLPSGLKLVLVEDTASYQRYMVGGTATKAGNYIVTVKITQNGASSLTRFNLAVKPNPFQGMLAGIVNESGIGTWNGLRLGEASVTIDASGTLKATLNDGRKKTSVTIKGYQFIANSDPQLAFFEGKMPKEKDLPDDRTIRFDLSVYDSALGIPVLANSVGSIVADNSDYSRDIWLHPIMDERYTSIAAEPAETRITRDWSTPYRYQYYTFAIDSNEANKYGVDFAGGYVALAYKSSSAGIDFSKATVTGRTPDGAKISTTVYPVYDFDDNIVQYSPVFVYNKTTGNSWYIVLVEGGDGGNAIIEFVNDHDIYPYTAGVFDDAKNLTWHGLLEMNPDFSSFVTQNSYMNGMNVVGELESFYFDPAQKQYASIADSGIELGLLKGADIKPTWNKTTGIITFKAKYPVGDFTFEGVPASAYWFRGWNTHKAGGRVYNGAFNFKTEDFQQEE